eukprot:gene15946-16112_t
MWAPDVYQGAPTAITAFLATVPKVAAFALLMRVLIHPFGGLSPIWYSVIAILAIISMLWGAIAALTQKNIKRFIAYSSIGHIGFYSLFYGWNSAITWAFAKIVGFKVGFTLPRLLPNARCALTTPFHPYLLKKILIRRYILCGTFPKDNLWAIPAGRYPALFLEKIARTLSDDVWIVAPEHEQSGSSHSLTLHEPLRIREVSDRKYAVSVNNGGNIAEDVTYSGTIAGAIEGTLLGIPSISLSMIQEGVLIFGLDLEIIATKIVKVHLLLALI